MPKMTGSRFIAETLKGYGVTTVFWVPAILKSGLMEMERVGIRRVLCHTEKAAAYMADGYARACRRPGIAMAQSVGAANLASGLQDAFLGCSPVIAITGRQRPMQRNRHAYQEIDHWPLYEPVTKYNVLVDSIEQLPFELRQAFRSATTGAPGPVHLDLAGLQGEEVAEKEADLEVVIEEAFTRYPAFRPEPEAERVRQAAQILAQTQRPVLVAGGGAAQSQAGPEIVRLAELLSMPVATSLNAKDVIAANHPLAVGVVGTYSHWCANQVVKEADLVVFVGSHTSDQVTDLWTVPKPGTPVIQIDLDPAEIGRTYPAQVPLFGDAKVTLKRLIEVLAGDARQPHKPEAQARDHDQATLAGASRLCALPSKSEWTDRARQLVSQWRREFEPMLHSSAIPIRPERLCKEITEFLSSDALLVSDTGHSGGWTGTMIDLKQPGQSYVRCAGSLGWAFPASLGAKCAVPERPVICFTGDGGMWYHLSEFETAVRCRIHTVTVVNNNHSLNQDKPGVDRAYVDYPTGNPQEMWVFRDVDFAQLARTMGGFGIRVERPEDIRGALEQALASEKPAVVDVVSDIDAFAPWTRKPEVPRRERSS